MTNKLPEAKRLADALINLPYQIYDLDAPKEAAALLLTQHALLEQARDAAFEIAWSNDTKWQSDRATKLVHALNQHLDQP